MVKCIQLQIWIDNGLSYAHRLLNTLLPWCFAFQLNQFMASIHKNIYRIFQIIALTTYWFSCTNIYWSIEILYFFSDCWFNMGLHYPAVFSDCLYCWSWICFSICCEYSCFILFLAWHNFMFYLGSLLFHLKRIIDEW